MFNRYRHIAVLTILACLAVSLQAQTADEVITKYVAAVGGAEKIRTVTTLKRSGKFIGGGGFEAPYTQENKRPGMVRQEFTIQGLVGVNAYDGKDGWKIEPWGGKKDPETLGEDEMKSILEDAVFDGPLVDYKEKGNKVEYIGLEPVEGTDAIKLKVTVPNGDVYHYYMDTDYFVPIKIETKRMIRGAEREFETTLGDYKEVNGWYLPFSFEVGAKGSPFKQTIAYEKIEANLPIDDARFAKPPVAAPAPGK
jgi:hypothetical protein